MRERIVTLRPQTTDLLDYLQEHNHITPAEASKVLGIDRLAARIYDLKKQGYNINKEIRRDFKGKRYSRYFLAQI